MWKRCGFLSVLFMICIICVTGHLAHAQSVEDDVFAVIKVEHPDAFIANIGKLVDQVEPGLGTMTSGMILGQLQQLVLKNPEWRGMEKAGMYTVVILDPMKYQSPLAVVAPLTDKDEYVGALSQTMGASEEVGGVYTFGKELSTPNMFVAITTDMSVISDDDSVTRLVKTLVAANSPILTDVPVVNGQLTASLSMSKILVSVRPMIEGFTQIMMMGMEQGMAQSGEGQPEEAQPPMEPFKNVLQTEIDVALALLEQAETLQLGVTIRPEEGIRLTKAVFPVAESSMAKFFAAQSPQRSPLLGAMPADSALIASGFINFTPEFITGYTEFSEAVGSIMAGEDASAAENMTQLTEDAFVVFGGDFVVGGFSQTDEVMISQIVSLKDAQKAKLLYEQYPEMMNSILGMYKSFGLDLDMSLIGKEEYKGGKIFDFHLGLDAEDIPDPEGQEVFKSLFGDAFTMLVGIIGNYSVIGIGKNARAQVQTLMETLDSGAEVAAHVTPTTFGLPEEHNFFMYLSLPRMMKWIATYMPEAPDFDIQDSPGIGMSAYFTDSHVEGELVVPVAEILAIRDAIEKANTLEAPEEGLIQETKEGK
jgi:hypothetical protein